MSETVLELEQVVRRYRTAEVETLALDGVDIRVKRGDFVAIMGPSGCGKSTLLGIAGLLDSPDEGRVHFLGEELTGLPEAKLAAARKRGIGFVFQNFNLIDQLSVAENVALPLLYRGQARAAARSQACQALDRMGLAHRAGHFPAQLSGGQQQRVAVARALVADPAMILADEPTGNLDSAHGEEVMRTLQDLNRQGTTIVMVTHDAALADLARRRVVMRDGRVDSVEESTD